MFDLRRPSGLASMGDLHAPAGERLWLAFRHNPRPVAFRGLAMPMSDGGMILNLSFGIGVVDAVRSFGLTDSDFAATDLAVEMMYLVKGKTAARETLKGFALRLQGDKQSAEIEAMTDALTCLRNRRALAQALERMTHHGVAFGLMHIDLDFFKAVNDTMGHAAGDHVLRKVAEILTSLTRAEDKIADGGGDEFVAVFPNLTEPLLLESIARQIIEPLTRPVSFEDRSCRISASIGITTSISCSDGEIARMQHAADKALYASKRAGRGPGDVSPDCSISAGPSRSQRAQTSMLDLQWGDGGVVRNHRLIDWFVPAIRAMRRGWFPRLLGHRASADTVF